MGTMSSKYVGRVEGAFLRYCHQFFARMVFVKVRCRVRTCQGMWVLFQKWMG